MPGGVLQVADSYVVSGAKPKGHIAPRRTQEKSVGVYLGCGCFWHVQYELIQAEKEILGRSSSDYTAVVGYAGGSGKGPGGRVCYKYDPDDYSKLGHTEVVYLEIPQSKIKSFAEAYWKLFVGIDRKDIVDVGADYRAAIGLAGGMNSPYLAEFEAAQKGIMATKMVLTPGKGSDPDTLGHNIVYVYDGADFPFYMGEVYHQFHDDFGGPYGSPPYPQSYNDLQKALLDRGVFGLSGCVNDADPIERKFQKVIVLRSNVAVPEPESAPQPAPAPSSVSVAPITTTALSNTASISSNQEQTLSSGTVASGSSNADKQTLSSTTVASSIVTSTSSHPSKENDIDRKSVV